MSDDIGFVQLTSGVGVLDRARDGITEAPPSSGQGLQLVVVNLLIKLANRRPRPDREAAAVPLARLVPMPTSPSFPS